LDNLLGHSRRTGRELCSIFEEHLREMGIEIMRTEVGSIDRRGDHFLVNGEKFAYVILATGSKPNEVDIPGALYFLEDEMELKGKKLLIIGGGDLAYDNALRAWKAGADVTLLRRGEPRANRMLLREVRSSGIREVAGDSNGIICEGEGYIMKGSRYHLLAAFIGRSPNRELITHLGPLEIYLPSFSTSVNGLYVVGDAALGTLSQTALSSGSGLAAAMHISQMVKER
jgi:thioredoxin reductase